MKKFLSKILQQCRKKEWKGKNNVFLRPILVKSYALPWSQCLTRGAGKKASGRGRASLCILNIHSISGFWLVFSHSKIAFCLLDARKFSCNRYILISDESELDFYKLILTDMNWEYPKLSRTELNTEIFFLQSHDSSQCKTREKS